MTAAKMLTGQDVPLGNMEMMLTNTFYAARERLKVQEERANRGARRRR